MRPFLLNLLLFLVVQLIVAAGILSGYRADPTSYYLEMAKKEQRLAEVSPPRLIVMGGSTGPFSYDGAALASATGMPTTVLAHHMFLGLTFILNQASETMRDNTGKDPDLYVFSMEYALLGQHHNIDYSALTELIAYHRSGIRWVGLEGGRQLLDNGHIIAGRILRRSMRLHLRGATRELSPGRPAYYYLNAFAPEGHIRPELLVSEPEIANKYLALGASSRSIQEVTEAIKDFAKIVRANGNELVLVLPPIPAPIYQEHEAKLAPILDAIKDIGIPILNDTKTIPSDPKTFLDTVYHRNQRGMELHTQHVIEWLRTAVANGTISPMPKIKSP